MKKMALAIVLFIVILSGCGNPVADQVLRLDIPAPINSLDPQFAADPSAVMIIGNIFEGLVTKSPDGEIRPGVADSWRISSDGLRYTFQIRQEASWSDGTPLTADDFVFAFHRLFNPAAPSPHIHNYMNIQNTREILGGDLPVSELGIQAQSDNIVVFTLSRPDPFFLESLADTPAMPCNRRFFIESRGRYALEMRLTLSNGPFSLRSWSHTTSIVLSQNPYYISETPVRLREARFYIGRGDPTAQFIAGRSDISVVSYSDLEALLGSHSATVIGHKESTWGIVFNQRDGFLGNPLIRQGFAHGLDRGAFEYPISGGFSATSVMITPDSRLREHRFRDMVGVISPLEYDKARAEALFNMGIQALEIGDAPQITFLIPDAAGHESRMIIATQVWRQYLGAFPNIQLEYPDVIAQRVAQGDFQMALMPFSSHNAQVHSMLEIFTSASLQNHFAYRSGFFDDILTRAGEQTTLEESIELYRQAEVLLLSDAVVIPVYFEKTFYIAAGGVEGVEIFPFSGRVYLRNAFKN